MKPNGTPPTSLMNISYCGPTSNAPYVRSGSQNTGSRTTVMSPVKLACSRSKLAQSVRSTRIRTNLTVMASASIVTASGIVPSAWERYAAIGFLAIKKEAATVATRGQISAVPAGSIGHSKSFRMAFATPARHANIGNEPLALNGKQ